MNKEKSTAMDDRFDLQFEFGIDSFGEKAQREFLNDETRARLEKVIDEGEELDPSLAEAVATGMKKWALSRGATHYTHWFQPLNGITAEKHDSFLAGVDEKGQAILSFSGKELIKGEPDASSFPSGGLRATFEARGYTAWDMSSPAFLIHEEGGAVLYIPTAFCSYTKEALDAKTPLLRAMEYVSSEAVRALHNIGVEARKVVPSVGAEQEYFLIDQEQFSRRKDLAYTGRTLFGAPSPKGQELEDHYFGPIRTKISAFMAEVNKTLWRLGVMAKTEHNEVAPSQHELANIYAPANIASDQNQLTMLVLRKVAKKHGLICLLAEKPFEGINGSGKHDNYSLTTDTGINLYKPGKDPSHNLPFLLFVTATIEAVHRYAGLISETAMSYGNDFRLGGHEAPPCILSIYLGKRVTEVLDSMSRGEFLPREERDIILSGSKAIPAIYRDNSDRNRTSPFAFTSNKFEFRMVGSSANISEANCTISAAIGKVLSEFSDYVESASDKEEATYAWIRKSLKEHRDVVFNGDGYKEDWVKEAKRRKLPSPASAVEAISYLGTELASDLFVDSGVFSESELRSREAIKYMGYYQEAMIDARTMSHMARKLLIPAANRYLSFLLKEKAGAEVPSYVEETSREIAALIDEAYASVKDLEAKTEAAPKCETPKEKANYAHDILLAAMRKLRAPLDSLELIVDKREWPLPSYGDLLFHTV